LAAWRIVEQVSGTCPEPVESALNESPISIVGFVARGVPEISVRSVRDTGSDIYFDRV
jgi:hypothetical protein